MNNAASNHYVIHNHYVIPNPVYLTDLHEFVELIFNREVKKYKNPIRFGKYFIYIFLLPADKNINSCRFA